MTSRFFEDLVLGETWISQVFSLNETEILDYARKYDPQAMHADLAAASEGPHRTIIAPGLQVAAMYPKMFFSERPWGDTLVLGLGMDELRWKQVVRPGDQLVIKSVVVDLRRSASNPSNGIVRQAITISDPNGRTVFSMFTTGLITVRVL